MNPTEFRQILSQVPTFGLMVEVTQPFKALPGSENLVGKTFVVLDPDVTSNNLYVVIHQLEENDKKVGTYATQYPIKGLKFLFYARILNDSKDPAMVKNLRIGELRE